MADEPREIRGFFIKEVARVGVKKHGNKESKLCRVCWPKGAEELRGRIKANTPVECEEFVLVG
jgi:hypothetical protein